MKNTNIENILAYLQDLVHIPSPTGFTEQIGHYLESNAQKKGIRCQRTRKGAVVYSFGPKNTTNHRMLAAHVDTLGGMVKEVGTDDVHFVPIGGFPLLYTIGDYCQIHGGNGEILEGTILPVNPSVHVNKTLSETPLNETNVVIRPDFVPSEGDALSAHIQVGDFVSFHPRFMRSQGFVKSRHLDDKASAAILLDLADSLVEEVLERGIHLFFNVTEETGQGIAGIPPIEDLLIIDMGVVGPGCQGSEHKVSICAKDSSGPYHHGFTRELVALAQQSQIPHVVDIFPFYGSDGSAFLRAGNDARTALIGPGVGASHGYERTHETALKATADLARLYLQNS